MTDLYKKNVFITGGSSGIGLSAAKQFAALGANTIIFSRKQAMLEKAVKEITSAKKDDNVLIESMPLDVSDNEMTVNVMEKAVKKIGAPDVLINSAGRSRPDYFENITCEQFEETLKVNLFGVRNTIAALLPYMKKNGGHIINVSSVAGFVGVFGFTDYSASKFGLMGFSESLRSECKKFGVLVSVLCPPDTDTPMLEAENATKPDETKAVSETGGLLQPDYVAKVMIKGIGKKRFIIIPGFMGKATYIVKRLFPGIIEAIMDWDIKKVQSR
ncbi:MAG: SDR family oxidoreductase [Deltaproteobacteria bacterium]|nr:SDR family oxidoreductase [Deltaproteobacteria bacterium]